LSSEVVGALGLVVLIAFIFLGMPIGFSFLIVGAGGLFFLEGFPALQYAVVNIPYSWVSNFIMLAIPLFILMGGFAYQGGLTSDLYRVLHDWFGRVRGGLAMATIGACGGFAAVSGSSLATAAAMGKVTYGEMRRYGYHPSLATGCNAAGGTLGALIPPSILFILYGLLVGASVGKLFLAGILPGILEVILYIAVIFLITRIKPSWGPPGPSVTLSQKIKVTPMLLPAILLSGIVLGGIYGGIFTPTEASAVGVVAAFIFLVARGKLTREAFTTSLLDTGKVTAMVFFLCFTAMIFNTFISITGLPVAIGRGITELGWPPLAILGIILGIYILAGMFLDPIGMMLLTLPIYLPIMDLYGWNLIWFGVLLVRTIEMGDISPPFGINCFILLGVAKSHDEDVTLVDVFRGVVPFFIMDIVGLLILMFFPQISLFLPGKMMK